MTIKSAFTRRSNLPLSGLLKKIRFCNQANETNREVHKDRHGGLSLRFRFETQEMRRGVELPEEESSTVVARLPPSGVQTKII